MIAVNLIPESRREGQRRRIRFRRWVTVVGGYALFLLVAMLVSMVAGSRDDQTLQDELQASTANIQTAGLRLGRLEDDLVESTALLTANRSVGNQPDWSVLLALIAEAAESDIVLRKCKVTAPDPALRGSATERDDADGPRTTVELHGLARTLVDVSDFVLRVESVPVFRDVTRHDTRREPFLRGHVVAFRLDFSLDGSGGGS